MKYQTKILLLIILTLCEIGCFFGAKESVHLASLLYAIAGISIAVVPMIVSANEQTKEGNTKKKGLYYGLYIAITLLICNWIINVFRAHVYSTPISQECDMLIFIKVMTERFLTHQHVYDLLPSNYGGPIHAVYLPAFWLPYSIPLYWGVDMRWATLAAFIGSILIASVISFRSFKTQNILLLAPVALLTYLVLSGAAFYLMFTQDALVLLYAAILSLALVYEYWWIAGAAAACCILSRYFIGIPFLVGTIWLLIADRKAAFRSITGMAMMLVVLITLSHSWSDIGYFFEIPFLYIHMLGKDMSTKLFQDICYQSIGLSSMLSPETMFILTKANLAVIVLVPVIYFLFGERYLASQRRGLILLCGIKLFLVLFLITLSLPYSYVFYTSSIVSIVLCRNAL